MSAGKGMVRQRPLHYFAVQVAVVEARPGESNEEAWRRHLRQHPQDRQATVKIFNRCPGPVGPLEKQTPV
jgi:hypothetical protein